MIKNSFPGFLTVSPSSVCIEFISFDWTVTSLCCGSGSRSSRRMGWALGILLHGWVAVDHDVEVGLLLDMHTLPSLGRSWPCTSFSNVDLNNSPKWHRWRDGFGQKMCRIHFAVQILFLAHWMWDVARVYQGTIERHSLVPTRWDTIEWWSWYCQIPWRRR